MPVSTDPHSLIPTIASDSPSALATTIGRDATPVTQAWRPALDRWLDRHSELWRQPDSPAQLLDRLTSSGFLAPPARPKGRMRASFPLTGTSDQWDGAFDRSAKLIVSADVVELDFTDAEASSKEIADALEAFERRYDRFPCLRLPMDIIRSASSGDDCVRRMVAPAPRVTLECEDDVADAIELGGEPQSVEHEETLCRITSMMLAGAKLRLEFRKASHESLVSICESTMPLEIDISPAVRAGEGLDWALLQEALRETASLAPALVDVWSDAGEGCSVTLSLKGFDALFLALDLEVDEERARHWVVDAYQFARNQTAWAAEEVAARRAQASVTTPELRWDFRPETGAIVPDAMALRGSVIQTQVAFQEACRHALRVGVRVTVDTTPEDLRQAVTRCVLFGAEELWITKTRRVARSRGVRREAPQVVVIPVSDPLVAVSGALVDWPASLSSEMTFYAPSDGLMSAPPEMWDDIEHDCDRCHAAMRETPTGLLCPTCGFRVSHA